MTEIFSFDNRKFYKNGQPFEPIIGEDEECTVARIRLPSRLEHDLQWKEAKESAEKALKKGKLLFWEFDFGLEQGMLVLHDTARFLSFSLAIEQFLTELFPLFCDHSFGVGLYRGDALFLDRFSWSEELEKNCRESGLEENVFCAGIFAAYMHRLASYLPDGLLPFCLIDASHLSNALAAQILSRGRFFHLHLAVKGLSAPIGDLKWEGNLVQSFSKGQEVGVILPPDAHCSTSLLQELDELLQQLLEQGQQPRIVPESLLNEHWDGLDLIVAIEKGLAHQGKRMLVGFAAAGGASTLF